jgi:formylglycine-generating enzyme required for sulfatase activity
MPSGKFQLKEIGLMKMKIFSIVMLALAVVGEASAKDKIAAHLRPLYATFGRNSTTKIKIVSGPADVKMRNGGVPGKQWLATSGKYRFKLTIQEGTGVTCEQLVKRLEKLPTAYMKACAEVSDKGEDGIAIYASLGGSRAHGGRGYINIIPYVGALVIAHEAGHTLQQVAGSSRPNILEAWKIAIMADKISVSDYGDHAHSEDLAEFALVYAVSLGEGPESLSTLEKLSPERFALWREILEPKQEKGITVDLGGGVKMEFVQIPAGQFMMGSGESTRDLVKEFKLPGPFVHYLQDEHPQHRVVITKPFYMGKYEVTQRQWKAIMGDNPSFRKGDGNPVETVNWNDCQAFIGKLNEKLGKQDAKFALPTEAQWEYACRAGTSTRFSFGDDKKAFGDYAWYGRNSVKKLQPIGLKKPNPWGLYDMNGNAAEWCSDWYGAYKKTPQTDPAGPSKGLSRVLRGGSFYQDTPDSFRSADRYHDHPDFRYYRYGLRLVRTSTPRRKTKAR